MQQLTPEQHAVISLVERGRSVFFTGAAGTGKSFLLREVVRALRQRLPDSAVAVTATTGLASFSINGQTLHRWAGVGTGEGPVAKLVEQIRKKPAVRDSWRRCRALVIDEVSMLDASLFDKLDKVARQIRGIDEPFGGIQLVLTGDFFQLPPVSASKQNGLLCFEAESWSSAVPNQMLLTKVFRQQDNRLVRMLNAMRTGSLAPDIIAEFRKLERPVKYDDGLLPTQLFPVRWQVEEANRAQLKQLGGPTFTFAALDSSPFDSAQKMLDQFICLRVLELKIGAQVLLVRNLSDQLVNGRRGIVVTFMSPEDWDVLGQTLLDSNELLSQYNEALGGKPLVTEDLKLQKALLSKTKVPVVDFRNGIVTPVERVEFSAGDRAGVLTRQQIPLLPAWALSIHKAQGQTIDRLVVDLTHVFEAGQAYVAVSRATSCDRLELRGFNPQSVRVHPRVASFYKSLASPSSSPPPPPEKAETLTAN